MSKVTIIVSGRVGSGKSALCGEIEILCKALGLSVEWAGGQQEKNLTHADWTEVLEMYKPVVAIVEQIERSAVVLGDERNEREAFEHWITHEGGYDAVDMQTHKDGLYILGDVAAAWDVWQGARAGSPQPQAQTERALTEHSEEAAIQAIAKKLARYGMEGVARWICIDVLQEARAAHPETGEGHD